MKKASVFVVLLMSFGFLSAQVDITGTWKGETEVPDFIESDQVTLVIKKVEGGFEGTITDSAGMAREAECRDIKLDGNQLTMNFIIINPDGEYIQVFGTMTVEGTTMKGYWESEDGNMNSITLEKQ